MSRGRYRSFAPSEARQVAALPQDRLVGLRERPPPWCFEGPVPESLRPDVGSEYSTSAHRSKANHRRKEGACGSKKLYSARSCVQGRKARSAGLVRTVSGTRVREWSVEAGSSECPAGNDGGAGKSQ